MSQTELINLWKSEVRHLEGTPRDELVDLPIKSLNPSVRMENLCLNADIERIGDLTESTAADIAKYRSMARKPIREMQTKLNVLGLSLKDDNGTLY